MTELGPIFVRLGLEQYLDSFIVEGFDSWETVLDIQEGDLDALNVKLGHRRKLQREIANHRGVLYERSNGSPTTEASGEFGRTSDGSPPPPTRQNERSTTETKRKYRRHPKPDKNAPERPPSAYVIFSNSIREEVRAQNLSFTDIAKLVGDRWQRLDANEKEPFESQANAAKERFKAELAQYQKTDAYKQYTQYIADFKAKHPGPPSDAKRAKFEQDPTSNANEAVGETRSKVSTTHTRDLSLGSIGPTSYRGDISSPKAATPRQTPTVAVYNKGPHLSRITSSSTANSPPLRSPPRDSRISPVVPVRGSVTPEAQYMRTDLLDLQSFAGQLSLAPLSTSVISPTFDLGLATRTAAPLPPPLLQHHSSSVSSVTYSDSSGASNALPTTPADEPWRSQSTEERSRSSEWPRIPNSLPGKSQTASFAGALPPFQPADRSPGTSHDPVQRALPLPAPSPPHDSKAAFRDHSRYPIVFLPLDSHAGGSIDSGDDIRSSVSSQENDAANALAVLASTGRRSP